MQTSQWSSLAQSVEHSAVNRVVVGSSPTGGAGKTRKFNVYGFYLFCHIPLGGKIDRLLKKADIWLLTEKWTGIALLDGFRYVARW